MNHETNPQRNAPAEKGRNNDPFVRDEDAQQPGVQTMSPGKNDEANQHLTRTAADNFQENKEGDEKADKKFDE